MENKILKIVIADDHLLYCECVKMSIESQLKYEVVAIVKNGVELLKILKNTPTDLILMDIMMDEMDGITATKIISQEYPAINIIGVSMYKEKMFIIEMLHAGAKGFLSKDFHCADLFNAIKTISDGKVYFTADILKYIDEEFKLTFDESNILNLVADGFPNKEIAKKLLIGKRKVYNIKTGLIKKFGAKNISHLIKLAIIGKWIRV